MKSYDPLAVHIPSISVILPVYNAERYVRESVQSVLDQSFDDFELIILNDGSTDGTKEILESFRDPRIRLVHQKNMGLALTLNKGILMSKGEFIARQDADDISLIERFNKQHDYLLSNPSCGIVGTGSVILVGQQPTSRRHEHPSSNGELQMRLLFDSFFVHSSVMMRRSALNRVGMYPSDPKRNPPEDFDLWLRLARYYEVANLDEPLVIYREVPNSISRSKADLINQRAIQIAAENLHILIGKSVSLASLRDLVALLRYCPQHMSNKPNWNEMVLNLKMARDKLIMRWPKNAKEIEHVADGLMKNIYLGRFRDAWIVKSAYQFGALMSRLWR